MNDYVRHVLTLVESASITPEEGRRRLRAAAEHVPAPVATAAVPAARPPSEPAAGALATGTDTGQPRIAIVGMSARYATGGTVDELWRGLRSGVNAVREIPPHRWDVRRFYDADPRTPGKSNSRWGGFLDDIDAFDPLFFHLSGAEAERMDPQQRLFLEGCWTALEDAGYAGDAVSGLHCGVFAGAASSDYLEDQRSGPAADAQVMTGNDTAILAARISYLLNLRGPSIALNTACSSSLVAIHLASQAIAAGQCELALAGGVCLFVTPSFYISASKAGMLSPQGRCATFDHRADGIVPGEGVGVVVLKDLTAAQRDGDYIRGVILAVDTNQDGRSNGITAPSARAQTELQLSVYRQAGINPESIRLVEAHGTGTALGDPIEIEALTQSFKRFTDRRQFCGIGSIKTNVGHTGQAAGVAGLIKCLLAFEHELIPPSLHFERQNPRINFAETPFFVPTSAVPWPRNPAAPRRAAVSSYGYSGTNAHLVVEEPPPRPAPNPAAGMYVFMVSAKTPDALDRRMDDLVKWLDGPGTSLALSDIAFSLHAGRKHFAHRAAVVADSTESLRRALRERRDSLARAAGALGADERNGLEHRLRTGEAADRRALLEEVAAAYERGFIPDVDLLFPNGGRRVPLPTYPFGRDRFWIIGTEPDSAVPPPPAGVLLTAGGVRDGAFRYVFRSQRTEFFITDHVIHGSPVLAAMASVELARAAAARIGYPVHRLSDLRWHRPLPSAEPDGLEVRLFPTDDDLRFEIGRPGPEWTPGITGLLRAAAPSTTPEQVNLVLVSARLTRRLDGAECYRRLAAVGLQHGPAFQVLDDLRSNDTEVLAHLRLPASLVADAGDLPLHPALLDGAVQAIVGLPDDDQPPRTRLPYALRELVVHEPLPAACPAYLTRRPDGCLDIRLLDSDGRVLIHLDGLATAELAGERRGRNVRRYRPVWRAVEGGSGEPADGPTLVLGVPGAALTALRATRPGAPLVSAAEGPSFRRESDDHYMLNSESTADYLRLWSALGPRGRPRRLLVCWSPTGGSWPDDFLDPDDRTLYRMLALVQAVTADRSADPPDITFVYPTDGPAVPPTAAAVGAFARSVAIEEPAVRIRTVGLPAAPGATLPLIEYWSTLIAPVGTATELRVGPDGRLHVPELEVIGAPSAATNLVIRTGGTYLITGGAGGIGTRLAAHLASSRTNLILLGRSELDESTRRRLDELTRSAASLSYLRADVADEAQLRSVLAQAKSRFGKLDGIVHAAGVTRDSFIRAKTPTQVAEVLRGKVTGGVLIDRLTGDEPLDFLVLLSSVVASIGNVGQADYAYANGVLDELAIQRDLLRQAGKRHGRTISIALPAWAGTGMAAGLAGDLARDGVPVLDDMEGLALFDDALHLGEPRLVVLGQPDVDTSLGTVLPGRPGYDAEPPPAEQDPAGKVRAQAESYLREVLAQELRVPAARIDPRERLEAYGIDSVMVTGLSQRLEKDFGPLPKTLFFEYSSLSELAGYFVDRHHAALRAMAEPALVTLPDHAEPVARRRESAVVGAEAAAGASGDPAHVDGIAVIGVSGRYPMADDLKAYWRNLADGRDCISEIPPDRWPLEGFYDPERRPHRSYSKWGGFLRDIDRFDAVFFGIAPREADMMDPQERLFLQTVWHVLEDAGYSRLALAGTPVGVFVGVMYGHYQMLGSAEDGRTAMSSYASIANRVSYFFDFHGPSMAVDTMCSSSLTATHLACESLRRGECRTAVVGGVNLTVHPQKYLQLSLAGFASSDGRCRSFGAGGDGYVPGEGVGALLLKPLTDAIADGDHIHVVIRGTAVNHGGRTNGYTVPNPHSQRAVIEAALLAGGVNPTDISYVEAHGTGTALGDPIEVAALTQAYGTAGTHRIPIGSVKSAIGHLESAAGVAAITKVILQMRHGAIAPSLHAEPPNPNIGFDGSPFYVPTRLAHWSVDDGARRTAAVSSFGAGGSNAHVVLQEWRSVEPMPATAEPHVLVLSAKTPETVRALAARLARYLGEAAEAQPAAEPDVLVAEVVKRVAEVLGLRGGDLGPHDSLLEAGYDGVSRVRLGDVLAEAYDLPAHELPATLDTAQHIAEWLAAKLGAVPHEAAAPIAWGRPSVSAPNLSDAAYTLQVGREHMRSRYACVATDLADAVAQLREFAAGDPVRRGGFVGTVPTPDLNGGPAELPFADEAGRQYISSLLRQRVAERLAELWAQGASIDWQAWHEGTRPRRIPLVGYPFAQESHWLKPAATPGPAANVAGRSTVSEPSLVSPPISGRESSPQPVTVHAKVRADVQRELVSMAATAIGLDPQRLDPKVSLIDYGFDSMTLKDLADRIADRFGVPFTPVVFFEKAGIAGIVAWLLEEHFGQVTAVLDATSATAASAPPSPSTARDSIDPERTVTATAVRPPAGGAAAPPIAIIGMSGRFPGSPTLDAFWRNLRDRQDLVTEVPAERWDWRAMDSEDLPRDGRCPFRWGGFIADADKFDPLFFGISPAEAEMMDPQQRLLLQSAWAALEDAGYRPSALAGEQVGLFAGIQFRDYQHLMHEAGVLNAQAALGNEHSIAVNRISYLLDLHGPSEPVNTACSSSLVAIHRAVRSLRTGESRLAIAGGIALNLAPHSTVAAGMMGLLSPDGKCKTLDRRANGYVKGEGVGVVVLKPLDAALAHGDHIYAVILGTAVNHGGRAASLTAPNAQAQAALLRAAIAEADIDPTSIGYLELHGTGTELGDPVEINGIKTAFRALADGRDGESSDEISCGLGSVKTNIGHLEPASGIAGLIKVVLAMRHQTLPGIVHLNEVNPYVDLTGTPFRIVKETVPWPAPTVDGTPLPRRAGVSSFGFGGVNAHVILEEHTSPVVPTDEADVDRLFVFSARTEQALREIVDRMLSVLDTWAQQPDDRPSAADVAYTLQTGREEMNERLAVVAPNLKTLRERLAEGRDTAGPWAYRGRAEDGAAPVNADADLGTVAGSWVRGATVDWNALTATERPQRTPRRVPLPTYPFAAKRFWFTAPARPAQPPTFSDGVPASAAQPVAVPIADENLSGEEYIRIRLREILMDKLKLGEDELSDDRAIQDFGVDSILSAMIMQVVQDELDVGLPLNALVDYPTVRTLARYIHDEFFTERPVPGHSAARTVTKVVPASSPSDRGRLPAELLPINTSGTRQPSFWVHDASGYSTWSQNLSRALGPEYPLYAFQARGTDGHSMPQTLEEMVDHYVSCMRLVQPGGPYVVGGYSFGGLVATEMARRLQEQGETVRHLILFDTYPATSEVIARHEGTYDQDFLQMRLVNYFLRVEENPERAIRPQDVSHIPVSLRVAELARMAKERGQMRISAEDIYRYVRGGLVCSEQAEGIYQIYKMRPYNASGMLFFQATDGFTGKASKLYWPPSRILDGYDYPQVWRDTVEGEFQVVELDNDHLNMLEEPTLTVAARHVEAVLMEPPPLDMAGYARFQESFDSVTRFGHELLASRFATAGALIEGGEGRSRTEIRERLAVLPEYDRLFNASMDILEREGFLHCQGDRLTVTGRMAEVAALADEREAAARAERLRTDHPEIADYVPLLTACQARVLDVASGRTAATDVLFPGGSMELVAELYKENVQTEFYNRLTAHYVAEHVRRFARRFPNSTAQVFEVGAGTGATTAFVDSLAVYGERLRYFYTDIGLAFVQMARQQFSRSLPHVDFATYNIERGPESQGFEPHSMDVVLASNVLHATRRIATTVDQCHQLLKPGGILVINELTYRLDYNTMTFGLTEDWWRYEEDDPRIAGSPLLDFAAWRDVLHRSGFVDVAAHGVPGLPPDEQAQCVIVATRATDPS